MARTLTFYTFAGEIPGEGSPPPEAGTTETLFIPRIEDLRAYLCNLLTDSKKTGM